MSEQFSRTELLIGSEGIEKLQKARVAVFGVGGVGGYVVEALARSGVGTLDIIDADKVCLSNLNRQIIATHRTIGQYKVDAAKERILEINPDAVVNAHCCFYLPETAGQFDFQQYDYVVDAIDTVTGKIELVMQAKQANTPIISSMGAGNKMCMDRHMGNDLHNILRLIADALHVGDHLHGGRDHPQIPGYGLLAQQQLQADIFHRPISFVDPGSDNRHIFRQFLIPVDQGVGCQGDDILAVCPHLHQFTV